MVCLATLLWVFTAGAQNPVPASNERTKGLSQILTAEGKVEVAVMGGSEWKAAQPKNFLRPGDRLKTGRHSRATVRLTDLSILRVNELSLLQIEAPPGQDKKTMLDMRGGSLYFFGREKPSETQFRTPVTIGALRGTEFVLAVAEDGRTTLSLLDGEVDLKSDRGQLSLKSGEQGLVETGRPPAKTALLEAKNIIQWCLYYPGVLEVNELALTPAEQQSLAASLEAWQSGDVLAALAHYPEARQPASDAERVYRAGLLLAVGQVGEAQALLSQVSEPSPLAEALRTVIAAVNFSPRPEGTPALASSAPASAWLAESYYLQSRSQLAEALQAARGAVTKAPRFGFAHARVAELEFSFGRVPEATRALDESLRWAARNAQAVALKGFLLSARNRTREALDCFDQAIALDGALGNAWLGRGLCRMREGETEEGLRDLQVAATLEPQRAFLRSYLGKGFSQAHRNALAQKELVLAKKIDPRDPTAWLYSALVSQQENRINEAVRALEQSQSLNDNRRVYRSGFLLDQDRAVRSANLAKVYQDAGLTDVSVREATRAVNSDYANHAAHLFLAESYDALRDPKQINLRYETPWLSELLVANLLAPVGGGVVSPNISQQEYSRMFEGDRLGVSSSTEYASSGAWVQNGSQFGRVGNFGYSLDAFYRTDPGQRPNNDLDQLAFSARAKQQLTPQDSVYLEASYYRSDSGDLAQRYDQSSASRTLRVKEEQAPNVYAGYHREWAPHSHTLALGGRLQDTLEQKDRAGSVLTLDRNALGDVAFAANRGFLLDYGSELEAYVAELQHILEVKSSTLVFGGRYQSGTVEAHSWSKLTPGAFPGPFVYPTTDPRVEANIERFSVYAYEYWQLLDSLQLTAGLAYDRLVYPVNSEITPVSAGQQDRDQVSPKVGIRYQPFPDTILRGAYTRSLGGVYYDTSVRLEPTQVAGFNQTFRSLIPESLVGLVPGSRFETWGLALDQKFKTGTYVTLLGEVLRSRADRSVGVFERTFGVVQAAPSATPEHLDYHENSASLVVNQLLGDFWSLSASYRFSEAVLHDRFPAIPVAVNAAAQADSTSHLQQVHLFVHFNHPSGCFGQLGSVWSAQSNQGFVAGLAGDDFWQFNALMGYRFLQRRAEASIGVLNFTDRNYQLHPLNLYSELPRERTFVASVKFNF